MAWLPEEASGLRRSEMTHLPIEPLLPRISEHVRTGRNLVIEAPPGAGKTTRVPPALLADCRGEVLVLEPRRLAARLAARRVAAEHGERVGQTVGYQVRFEDVSGPQTRLRFMTEGVLTRRLLSDPQLRGVDVVVLDEFHERHLDGDVALALLRHLQSSRKDLRLVVMSATLNAAPVADYLGRCPTVRSEGRLFELAIRHQPYSEKPLEDQVAAALRILLEETLDGDVLVFLPGAAEIRRAARACQGLAGKANLILAPLHGDLSPEEQDRAVLPADRRKVILSTNVAESSVTIEGVRAVIDSGLARIASDSPWTGLATLQVSRVSQASATQRAGRAGRTGPGKVIRLFSAEDYSRRAAHETPEIERRELSQTLLDLKAMGVARVQDLPWFEPPPEAAVTAAEDLLKRLGALDEADKLTATGKQMARLPLHPRLSRLVLEADKRGAGEDGCEVAALLSSGERLSPEKVHAGPSDLLLLLDSPRAPRTRQIAQQIRRVAKPAHQKKHHEEALLLAILAAFPDRVAKRRQDKELQLAAGGPAVLAPASVVSTEFLVAVDVEERREQGPPLVRLASAIEPEWLLDLFPSHVSERRTLEWHRTGQRVEETSALLFDGLVIEESRGVPTDAEAAARMLAEKAWEAGVARFVDAEEFDRFLVRVAFAAAHSAIPRLTDEDVRAAIESLCTGRRSFSELQAAARDGGLLEALRQRIPADARRLLDQVAPERIKLPGGRFAPVNYAVDQPPWIASRLQDFFGLRETPRVARGKVPVVVHLLAPNRRPVQMTSDLAGFWERLYPQVRRELCRRYPKHSWPENPR